MSIELESKKKENKQKEDGIGRFKKIGRSVANLIKPLRS